MSTSIPGASLTGPGHPDRPGLLRPKLRGLSLFCFVAILAGCAAANAAEQLYTVQPSLTPELANPGGWPVGVMTIDVTNPAQLDASDFSTRSDRTLKLEVWYPATARGDAVRASYDNVTRLRKPFSVQGEAFRDLPTVEGRSFPLVILSHGYTGYRSIMFYLGEHLASHGYVVAGIDHTDSTNAEVDFVNSGSSGFPSTLLNRARDQQFVLDELSGMTSALGQLIDAENAAVIGYSMGGYGALNTVGGCYVFTPARVQAFGVPADAAAALAPLYSGCNAGRDQVDPRWKAMVAFAPWGQQQDLHNVEKIRVPSLYVGGAEDDISGYENGVAKLFRQTGSQQKYMLVYQNARHNIAPHPAPRVAWESAADMGHYAEASWNSEQLNRINKHITLAFLDCYVKRSGERCAFLPTHENITQQRGADGKLSEPWPGFQDRWGLGVIFYHGAGAAADRPGRQ